MDLSTVIYIQIQRKIMNGDRVEFMNSIQW